MWWVAVPIILTAGVAVAMIAIAGQQQNARELYDDGYELPYDDGYELPYDDGYELPYDDGYELPYDNGYELPYDNGYELPYDNGYELPYDNGYELPPHKAQPTTNNTTKDKKKKKKRKKKKKKSKDNICVICYENLTKFTSSLSCKHIFHIACINQWLEEKTTCPICRKYVL